MTCKQIGGACDQVFQANTFDEMADLSKAHAVEMFQQMDAAHLQVMNEMSQLMQDPEAMQKWMDDKRAEFDALPDD